MHPGDFILTPSWTYHDHGNPGEAPVVWMDGLDVPIVNLFDTSFLERYPDETQPNTIAEGDAQSRHGREHAASRLHTGEALVADLQLSVLEEPRGTQAVVPRWSCPCVPWREDALRQFRDTESVSSSLTS